MSFDILNEMIEEGMEGKDQFIPIGLSRLGRYANIRKRILTLIFSSSGAGKSSLLDTIILNACLDHLQNPSIDRLKPDFQLFSMERSKTLRIAKWLSLIFKNEGIEIPIPKMLGWWKEKLSKGEYDVILRYKTFIDEILEKYITIHEGAKTPNEIYRVMKDHLEETGTYEKVEVKGKEHKIYTPNDNNVICIPMFDHGNLTKTTKELPTKKQAIDKLVEYVQGFRDLEGCSPIWVAQVNRSITGVARIKDQEHELMLDDVKESGDIADACDLAISLFNPIKFGQSSKTGYIPSDFVDGNNGNNYFRSAQILKSSYGADDLRIPLAFNGFCGQFTELPRKKDLTDNEYQEIVRTVLSKQYFLNE